MELYTICFDYAYKRQVKNNSGSEIAGYYIWENVFNLL